MKKIKLSVSEFAVPAPRKGSIDIYSGYGAMNSKGIEIHQRVQAQRKKEHSNYRAEVPLFHIFEVENFSFEISGRMDGIFDTELPKIEEIKSSFNIYELLRKIKATERNHPYYWQIKTYGYFHFLVTKKIPELSLHLISMRDGKSLDVSVPLDIIDYEIWLKARLAELVNEAQLAEKRVKRRIKASKACAFPFAKPRLGQIELIETIENGMKQNRPMMIQAPTGLGKTIGVLYPTMREALNRGQQILYVTPKNSQHAVATDAIELFQEQGASIKTMALTSKSKMCMKNETLCNPEYCEYAKDYYEKVSEHQLVEQLNKKRKLSSKTFKKMAEEYQVCPFELQLDIAHEVDAIVCDYNYVFAPRSALHRVSSISLDQQGKPNLLIDEAHNLPARSMDYYSPSLSVQTLEKMRERILKLEASYQKKAAALLDECIQVIKSSAPSDCKASCLIQVPLESFWEQDEKLRSFLNSYLNSDAEIQSKDVVLELSFYWSEFTEALEFTQSGREEFLTTYSPHPPTIKITCCDASEMLSEVYKNYDQVVAFSATLKPFEFYSKLAGLDSDRLITSEFVSPFSKSKRKLILIPQISSKYLDRTRSYPRIAEAIQKVVLQKPGNYFAFFPSFEFMERVFSIFISPLGFHSLKQERQMKLHHVEEILNLLKLPESSRIVFAVQGGVFSEGVDYPGEMLIGSFVVGPPLPNFNLEREKMKEYYEKKYGAGFDYAYTFPAMSKAVQAAGRVIRSETDKGIIVLMDSRFLQQSYSKSMPKDWYDRDPSELVSENILKDISEFWSKEN